MIALIYSVVLAAFMRFGPDIPFNRFLSYHLAEKPVSCVLKRDRNHYVFLLVAGAIFLLGGEIVIMFGPEFILAYAADLALYLDIVVVSALAASLTSARRAFNSWGERSMFARTVASVFSRRSVRSPRAHRKPPQADSANDDEDDRDWAYGAMTRFVA